MTTQGTIYRIWFWRNMFNTIFANPINEGGDQIPNFEGVTKIFDGQVAVTTGVGPYTGSTGNIAYDPGPDIAAVVFCVAADDQSQANTIASATWNSVALTRAIEESNGDAFANIWWSDGFDPADGANNVSFEFSSSMSGIQHMVVWAFGMIGHNVLDSVDGATTSGQQLFVTMLGQSLPGVTCYIGAADGDADSAIPTGDLPIHAQGPITTISTEGKYYFGVGKTGDPTQMDVGVIQADSLISAMAGACFSG